MGHASVATFLLQVNNMGNPKFGQRNPDYPYALQNSLDAQPPSSSYAAKNRNTMNDENQPIQSAPIVEAVVDIDCDLPQKLDLHGLQGAAGDALRERYPKFRQQLVQQHIFKQEGGKLPETQVHQGLGAMQFVTDDERQLIQFRLNGFSFNRLAPYKSFDEYLPEIESGWRVFLQLAQPVVIRKLGIRMINRIMLPLDGGKLDFGDFLSVSPRLPDTGAPLSFLGFLDQQMALDGETGNHANIIKTTELPQGENLPLILDIDVFYPCETQPTDWRVIRNRLDSLRSLKNRIFRKTLTQQCLNLFSPQA